VSVNGGDDARVVHVLYGGYDECDVSDVYEDVAIYFGKKIVDLMM
jgi:hypothetical protein